MTKKRPSPRPNSTPDPVKVAALIRTLIKRTLTSHNEKTASQLNKAVAGALDKLRVPAGMQKAFFQDFRIGLVERLASIYRERDEKKSIQKLYEFSLGLSGYDMKRSLEATCILVRTSEQIMAKHPDLQISDNKERAAFNLNVMFQRVLPGSQLAIDLGHKNYRKLTNRKTPKNWRATLDGDVPNREQATRYFLEHCASYSKAQIEQAIKILEPKD